MKTVAILCAARNSIYKTLEACDVYDIDRDARTFRGGIPVIAHPPCRLWSAFCSHQAKADDPDAEKELGIWCIEQAKQWGGVVEQPAHSRLFAAAGVTPTIEVKQSDWGHYAKKGTWLYVQGNFGLFPPFPRISSSNGCRRKWQVRSKHQRSATPLEFAKWLIALARMCDVSTMRELQGRCD